MFSDQHPVQAARDVGRSFMYAFAGLIYTLHSQRNMRFHLFFAIFTIAFYTAFDVPRAERAILMIVICLVPAFEIINTSIESQMDYVGHEQHVLLKRAKDTAAAAVLVMALLSMGMGGYVLLPGFIRHYADTGVTTSKVFQAIFDMLFVERFRGPQTHALTVGAIRWALALLVIGGLLTFWLLRGIPFLFKPLLAAASFAVGLGSMALCICGRDPSAYVAMTFLLILELNAFARLTLHILIKEKWEDEGLPLETAGFKIIIPFITVGAVAGGWLGWGPLAVFCK
jgi:diacylglycerol kinase